MRTALICLGVATFFFGGTARASAQQAATPATASGSEVLHIESGVEILPDGALSHLNTETAEIPDVADARALLEATIVATPPAGSTKPNLDDPEFYAIIHVMKWAVSENKDEKTKAQGPNKADPSSTANWYVYHAGRWSRDDFATKNRLFGVRRIWLVFVHLDQPQAAYRARYQFSVTKKQPAVLVNAAGLAGMFFTAGGSRSPHGWGGGFVDIHDVPSDVTIQPLRIINTETSNTFAKLGEPKTFDNEGRYWFDFGVGVPLKAGKQLQVDGSSGAVSPKKVDKQNIFALVNLFPQPVDVKTAGFRRVPHVVAGVAIAKEPLHRILVAGGWGPAFANFYLGALIVKQPVADKEGKRWDQQLAFGVNLTVKGTQQALQQASK